MSQLDDDVAEVDTEYNDQEIWKRWFKTRAGAGGFISLRPWYEAGKITVDIGASAPEGGLKSSTAVWTSIVGLSVYLNAVYDGKAVDLYPADEKANVTCEGFVSYGGGETDKGPVSRILKIGYWANKDGSLDMKSFVWKTGMFVGRRTASGAYLPDTSKPISTDMIRCSRLEMAEINLRLNIGLQAHACQNKDWAAQFSGKRKK